MGGDLGLDDMDLLPEDGPAEQGQDEQRPSSQGPLPNGPEAGPDPTFDIPDHLQVCTMSFEDGSNVLATCASNH